MLIQPSELQWKKPFFGQIVLVMCLFFFVEGFMCYVLNFFKKWAFMCLWGHVLIKKMSVGMVKKRATNIIRKIHRINKFLPLKLKLILYNTLIVPIFNYADFQILTFKLVSAASFIYYFIYYCSFLSLFITALPGLNIAIIDFFAQTHFL